MTDFLEGLQGTLRRQAMKAWALLERVAEVGPNRLGPELSKALTAEIFEFRPGDLRVLWFYDAGRVVVCTHGFAKKSRRTPRSEIERAEASRQRYFDSKKRRSLEIEAESQEDQR